MKGSVIQKSLTTLSFLLTKPSLANCATIVPPKKNYSDFQSLLDGGFSSKEALALLKLKQPLASGQENYEYLTSAWQRENMRTSKEFFRWCNNNEVVPTLQAMLKMIDVPPQ